MCWATDGGSVWEAVPGQAARQVLAAQERWIEAAFAPSGTALLARTDREVQSWNLESGGVSSDTIFHNLMTIRIFHCG